MKVVLLVVQTDKRTAALMADSMADSKAVCWAA